MTGKVYRSAQGKIVDLGALQLRNENVRAVGNMGVNARGDIVDSNNRAIDSKNNQVSRQYQRQTKNVNAVPAPQTPSKVNAPPPPEDFFDDFDKSQVANDVARARQVKQDPL